MTGNVIEYFVLSGAEQARFLRKQRPVDDLQQVIDDIKTASALPLVFAHAPETPPKARAHVWSSVFDWLAKATSIPRRQTHSPVAILEGVYPTTQVFYDLAVEDKAWLNALKITTDVSSVLLAMEDLEQFRAEHQALFARVAIELQEQVRAAEVAESVLWSKVVATIDQVGADEESDAEAAAFQRTVQLRDWLIANERWLSSEDIALRARGAVVGSNKDQYAYQLRHAGRILGVRHQRKRLHPACQFHEVDGRLEPLPVMPALLEVLPADDSASGWDQALWLFQPTGRLGGARPADVLATRPDEVLDAAKKDFHGDPGI